jgi:hypothetical protein
LPFPDPDAVMTRRQKQPPSPSITKDSPTLAAPGN